MKNLEGIKIGDKVFDFIFQEYGVVTSTALGHSFPIKVKFDKLKYTYSIDGRINSSDKLPRLFFDDPNNFTVKQIMDGEYPTRLRWKPELGEIYYFIHIDGRIEHSYWQKDYNDIQKEYGNVFKTEKEAREILGQFKEILKNR